MILDSLDVFILIYLLENKKKTNTFEIVTTYSWLDKPRFEDNRSKNIFLSKKLQLVKLRLKTMSKEGLIRIDRENNKNVYVLLPDRALICKRYLPDDKKHSCLFYQDKDSKWAMIQID